MDNSADRSAEADGDANPEESVEPGKSGSRHYRRAQRDRGAETRTRLIEAALDVFGRYGFEGATTRQIAKEADANLAAIVYHFGSKEALHLAVAEYIVERTGSLVAPAMASAATPEASATPEAARATLQRLLGTYIDVILGTDEAERWARFIVREQLQPTEAFDVIYDFMGGSHVLGTRLVATILGRDQEDEEIKLKVFTIMGQIMVFRLAQTLVLRRMEWSMIGEEQRNEIKRIVFGQVDTILGGEPVS